MCTVFAESEVISLIADNHTDSDIIHGLNQSIAGKTAAMAARAKGQPPYMMTGGVARNRGVVQALEEKKRHYEGVLQRELDGLDDEFSVLKLLSQELQVRARSIRSQRFQQRAA